jgi:GTP-binding protein
LVLLLIDVDGKESKDIEEESEDLLRELKEYDNNLAEKVKWLVLNKMDLISKEKQMKLKEYFDKQRDLEVCLISAMNRQGTENLMKEIGYKLEKIDE